MLRIKRLIQFKKRLRVVTFLFWGILPLQVLSQRLESAYSEYFKDSFPVLVSKCSQLLSRPYMAQTFLGTTDTIPGWVGYPVSLYTYETCKDIYTGKTKIAKVYLLNPSPEKLAHWIMTACWDVKHDLSNTNINKMFQWVKSQSGAQFPVKGIVYEDQYTKGFYEPYLFKDGVTVYLKDSTKWPQDKTCTLQQIDFYLTISDQDIKARTGQFARIAGTTREDYVIAGGTVNVGNAEDRKLEWLQVVRALYKSAWNSDRNELMILWAKRHL